MTGRLPILVSMGDPAGIGPELMIMAWAERHALALPAVVYVGDAGNLAQRARDIGVGVELRRIDAPREGAAGEALPVIDVPCGTTVVAGHPTTAAAPAVIAAIERATKAVIAGEAAALVTNPIAKSVLTASGFGFPGHTEFLSALATAATGVICRPVMLLAAAELRVVPVTIHEPLARVPALITRELLVETAEITLSALRRDFGIAAPRLAVAGLNPHAGENGTIGREEVETIAPAVADLVRRGHAVAGPLSADTLFHAAARTRYDAVLAMYHDQALIPLKTLAFDRGVNVTLGLPFVRTSPDHGTAFDIAGTGRASITSFVEAIKLAAAIAERRRSP